MGSLSPVFQLVSDASSVASISSESVSSVGHHGAPDVSPGISIAVHPAAWLALQPASTYSSDVPDPAWLTWRRQAGTSGSVRHSTAGAHSSGAASEVATELSGLSSPSSLHMPGRSHSGDAGPVGEASTPVWHGVMPTEESLSSISSNELDVPARPWPGADTAVHASPDLAVFDNTAYRRTESRNASMSSNAAADLEVNPLFWRQASLPAAQSTPAAAEPVMPPFPAASADTGMFPDDSLSHTQSSGSNGHGNGFCSDLSLPSEYCALDPQNSLDVAGQQRSVTDVGTMLATPNPVFSDSDNSNAVGDSAASQAASLPRSEGAPGTPAGATVMRQNALFLESSSAKSSSQHGAGSMHGRVMPLLAFDAAAMAGTPAARQLSQSLSDLLDSSSEPSLQSTRGRSERSRTTGTPMPVAHLPEHVIDSTCVTPRLHAYHAEMMPAATSPSRVQQEVQRIEALMTPEATSLQPEAMQQASPTRHVRSNTLHALRHAPSDTPPLPRAAVSALPVLVAMGRDGAAQLASADASHSTQARLAAAHEWQQTGMCKSVSEERQRSDFVKGFSPQDSLGIAAVPPSSIELRTPAAGTSSLHTAEVQTQLAAVRKWQQAGLKRVRPHGGDAGAEPDDVLAVPPSAHSHPGLVSAGCGHAESGHCPGQGGTVARARAHKRVQSRVGFHGTPAEPTDSAESAGSVAATQSNTSRRMSSLAGHRLSSVVSVALSQAVSAAAGSEWSASSDELDSVQSTGAEGDSGPAEALNAGQGQPDSGAAPALQGSKAVIPALAALQSMASYIPQGIATAISALTSPRRAAASAPVGTATSDVDDVSPAASSVPSLYSEGSSVDPPHAADAASSAMPVQVVPWSAVSSRSSSGALSQLGSAVRTTNDADEGPAATESSAEAIVPHAQSGDFFGEDSVRIATVPDRATAARDAIWFGIDEAAPSSVRFASGTKPGSRRHSDDGSSAAGGHSRARRRWGRIASEGKGLLASGQQPAGAQSAASTEHHKVTKTTRCAMDRSVKHLCIADGAIHRFA